MDKADQAEQGAATLAGRDGMIDRTQTDWYKDAIIYQLHVKAFQDANGDGIGDFAGLMQRLDHVQELGRHRDLAAAVLSLAAARRRLRHRRLRVDQSVLRHDEGLQGLRRRGAPARPAGHHRAGHQPHLRPASLVPAGPQRAKPGSAARDFYVWSDTDAEVPGDADHLHRHRKVELDLGPGRRRSSTGTASIRHQPDLNFDNPAVLREVLKVMHIWLDMGVDGLRLDAIPYLVEREGTNNENLPETHDVLKEIRAELDAHYPDRMLLAEANQWPEDTRPYFGEGDECHMGFHFPLMPRMYMALAQEDRHPITDIIRQTPGDPRRLPVGHLPAQPRRADARNGDRPRSATICGAIYAEDSRARINLGIRRRLAPLMQNDRRKIELLNSLLMSMPGTPILYYGDEIGMGDNYYLGDRDGVRTPMQWSADRNAGFSRANPQQLYLPAIQDPIYGYQAINVESAGRRPVVAAELDAADDRGAQAARGVRRGDDDAALSAQPQDPRLCARARGRDVSVRRQPLARGAGGRDRSVGASRARCRSN